MVLLAPAFEGEIKWSKLPPPSVFFHKINPSQSSKSVPLDSGLILYYLSRQGRTRKKKYRPKINYHGSSCLSIGKGDDGPMDNQSDLA